MIHLVIWEGIGMAQPKRVVFHLFNNVEDLDFAGPLEVFGAAGRPEGAVLFELFTVAEKPGPIKTGNGLIVTPDYTFNDCPQADILVLPGGKGTRIELKNPTALEFVRKQAAGAEYVLTVCTGSLVLAAAGLLKDQAATTHRGALGLLKELEPTARVQPWQRVIDNGDIIVAAGVSAGIDAALHLVERIHGQDTADSLAYYIEYDYHYLG